MNSAIAQHLNVLESAIVRVEEWVNVMFVVVKGLGARFVSKKVMKKTSFEEMVEREQKVRSTPNSNSFGGHEYMHPQDAAYRAFVRGVREGLTVEKAAELSKIFLTKSKKNTNMIKLIKEEASIWNEYYA